MDDSFYLPAIDAGEPLQKLTNSLLQRLGLDLLSAASFVIEQEQATVIKFRRKQCAKIMGDDSTRLQAVADEAPSHRTVLLSDTEPPL